MSGATSLAIIVVPRGELCSWARRGGIVPLVSGEAGPVYAEAWSTASLVAANIAPSAS